MICAGCGELLEASDALAFWPHGCQSEARFVHRPLVSADHRRVPCFARAVGPASEHAIALADDFLGTGGATRPATRPHYIATSSTRVQSMAVPGSSRPAAAFAATFPSYLATDVAAVDAWWREHKLAEAMTS